MGEMMNATKFDRRKPRPDLIDTQFLSAVEVRFSELLARDEEPLIRPGFSLRYWWDVGAPSLVDIATATAFLLHPVCRPSLNPFAESVGYALAYGTTIYGPNNWRLGMEWSRLYAAAMRHWGAFEAGMLIDVSGAHHLGCFGFSVMCLEVYSREGLGKDDRRIPRPSEAQS